MITATEVQDFFVGILCTALGICAMGIIGALCWWAWASESLANILTLAGLMGMGACILVAVLLWFLSITEDKQ